MTTTSTTPKPSPATGQGPRPATSSVTKQLKAWVRGQATALQRDYLGNDPQAVSRLARLRHSAGRPVGSDPDTWELLGGMPAALVGTGDEPSRSERAVIVALTLFAVHQQSQRQEMHRPRVGLGQAVRRLSPDPQAEPEAAVVRRFKALGVASTPEAVERHLRSLVTQLRAIDQPLDYGQLAVDLWLLQDPSRAAGVRLRWGRDFYTFTQVDETPSTDPSTQTPGEPS